MVSRDEAIASMEKVISYITEDKLDEHTEGTAARFIKAWDNDWAEGYDMNITHTTFSSSNTDQMIIELDIPVVSHCAHHLAPIIGVAHVAYMPSDRLIGLSKMNRIVEQFSRRLQVQERLTDEIAEELFKVLKPNGVGVQIIATHMCVSTRGVRHHGTTTVTSKLLGCFTKPAIKAEFLSAINSHGGK